MISSALISADAQVRATTPASCRVLPHVLSHISQSATMKQMPQLRTLTLLLLRLTHHSSSAATRAAAAACTLAADSETAAGATAAANDGRRRSSRHRSSVWGATRAAVIAAAVMAASRGRTPKGVGKRHAVSMKRDDRWKEGSRLPDAWADDPAWDRLSVSVENGRDVGCAIAVHALCTVYESVRNVLIGSVHNDTWYVLHSFSSHDLKLERDV
jgi:hypothetical protein